MFAEALRKHLDVLQVELSPRQIKHLEQHFHLLSQWNKVLNLTRIENLEETIQRHYCESLFLGAYLPKKALRIADLGSGAGFPGVPVAVIRPDCQMTLVEAHQRKSVFLREATREMENVQVFPQRVEEVAAVFDWAISRGVKYEQIKGPLISLAPNVALLAGGESPDDRFTWNKIKLPWGERRFLWLRRST